MRLRLGWISIALGLAATLISAQTPTINLAPFGYQKVMKGRFAEPAFAAISYVGDDCIFVTFPKTESATNGLTLDYTAIVLNRQGLQLGKTQLTGLYSDVLQQRIAIQPLSNVLVKVEDQLRIYATNLESFESINLPPRSQVRVPPDRKSVVAIYQDGDKSKDTIIDILSKTTRIELLDFNERAVRDGLLAVSNDGSVAHAVRDTDGELTIHSWSLRWPTFSLGKFHQPFAFTRPDELLVSATATNPFPPTELYLWKQDGTIRKVRGSKAGFYSAAQPSLDGQRIMLTQTNINDFLVLIRGGDCGDCGESDFYSVIDVPSAKVLLKRKRRWNCTEALSPSGNEIAELCDGVVLFYSLKK